MISQNHGAASAALSLLIDASRRAFRSLASAARWTALLAVVVGAPVLMKAAAFHLHLVGDSTMADKPVEPPNPERGWGQLLPMYFSEPGLVVNHALNGRSTKSFIDEGTWAKVLQLLQPGDWVIIQFGHNDSKQADPKRYADPKTAYPENLRRLVRETRAAGAHPILATPIVRRKFDEDGKLVETHGLYPGAMRALAAAENVPLLELNILTRDLVAAYGPERSKQLYLHIAPGEYAGLPNGRDDDTHLSAVGASRVSELAAAEIRRLKLPLADALK